MEYNKEQNIIRHQTTSFLVNQVHRSSPDLSKGYTESVVNI